MKALLVIDIDDNIDIKNTQATYVELQCDNHPMQISLINHWLKPLPQKKYVNEEIAKYDNDYDEQIGWNDCIDELLGDTK